LKWRRCMHQTSEPSTASAGSRSAPAAPSDDDDDDASRLRPSARRRRDDRCPFPTTSLRRHHPRSLAPRQSGMDRSSSPSPLYDGGSRPTGRPTFQPSSPSPLYQSSHASSSRAGPSSARQPPAARRPHQPSDPLSSPLQATSQAQRQPSVRSASEHVTLGCGGMRSSPTAGPSRSGPSSPSPRSSGPPSGSQAPPPPTVVDVLWRERFKARCSDRVKRERARAVRHERERRGVVWESSEGDSGMDLDDDSGEDGGEDEEVEKEVSLASASLG
jgi:hypothetical protein